MPSAAWIVIHLHRYLWQPHAEDRAKASDLRLCYARPCRHTQHAMQQTIYWPLGCSCSAGRSNASTGWCYDPFSLYSGGEHDQAVGGTPYVLRFLNCFGRDMHFIT